MDLVPILFSRSQEKVVRGNNMFFLFFFFRIVKIIDDFMRKVKTLNQRDIQQEGVKDSSLLMAIEPFFNC